MELTAISSLLERSEARPLLWLGGGSVLLLLHLLLHPQAHIFRRALRWMARHPAPLLLYAVSVMLDTQIADWRPGPVHPLSHHSPLHAWPEVWVDCLRAALHEFALVFHTAVAPLAWGHEPLPLAIMQSLMSAFSQIWLCCTLTLSLSGYEQEWLALRQTVYRWRSTLLLSLCHLPWWWLDTQTSSATAILRDWLLPEFFLFLAPLPLAIACTASFGDAGAMTLRWWRAAGPPLAVFGLTAITLLAGLEYAVWTAAEVLPPMWSPAAVLVESLMAAGFHVLLFVSAALIILPADLFDREREI